MGTQEFRDLHGAFDDTGIAGTHGLLEIIAQSNIEAVTLAGNFGRQQSVQGIWLELSIRRWLLRLRGNGWRHGCWRERRLGGMGCTAGDQQADCQAQKRRMKSCCHGYSLCYATLPGEAGS